MSKLFFILLLAMAGCAAVQGQVDRDRWADELRRGMISESEYTDLLLTQHDMEEVRRVHVEGQKP